MLGHDVVRTLNTKLGTESDPQQLLTATDSNRTLVTHNTKDFVLLHIAWRRWTDRWGIDPGPHAGVVGIPQKTHFPVQEAARQIDALVSQVDSPLTGVWAWNLRSQDWQLRQ